MHSASDKQFSVKRIGDEQEPVVIIDNFSSQYLALLTSAELSEIGDAGKHYPGRRAPADASYLAERSLLLETILRDVFDMQSGARLMECNYSIVTTPPSELSVFQRLPHFDTTDPGVLALLHYCCDDCDGGTSFYQHRSTGYETISDVRLDPYRKALEFEIGEHGDPPARYMNGSDHLFERKLQIAAKPNRMIIYRGQTLHSGDILCPPSKSEPDGHPSRMTINTFLAAKS